MTRRLQMVTSRPSQMSSDIRWTRVLKAECSLARLHLRRRREQFRGQLMIMDR